MPRIAVPPSAAHVAAIRRALADDLQEVSGHDAIADATLVLSELVSNALRHARPLPDSGLRVDWEIEDGPSVLIAVTDGSSDAEPRPRPAEPGADSGRGLAIIESLASAWGVRRTSHDKTVWARVPLGRRLGHSQ